MWPVVRIAVIIENSNPSLCIFAIGRVAGWKRSIGRPPRPQDNDRDNVDENCNDNDDDNENDDHHSAVKTNSEESDRANFYLAPFDNTTIQYVVVAMV